MRKILALLAFLIVSVAVTVASTASAASTISATLPEFSGTTYSDGFPRPAVIVGSFDFTLPAEEVIVGATISGYFGNSAYPNSAGVDVFLNGDLVGRCERFASCYFVTTEWSRTLSASEALSLLESGTAELSAVQTSEYTIRLAPTTLTIQTIGREDCRYGGWVTLGLGFKTQGDCVSYVATGGRNTPARDDAPG